jgi:hypothetical protein
MRVWLVDERREESPGHLEFLLKQLADRPDNKLLLLGAKPLVPEVVVELRAQSPDILVVAEAAWPEAPWTEEVLNLGASLVVATTPEQCTRFRVQAELHPIWLLPPKPDLDCLQLALLSALAGQRRHEYWKTQVARLQQRLNDRIVIERAKGILVQSQRISEEEAYKRLRVQSRRQRKQIRDIAQALLETQPLLWPAEMGNGPPEPSKPEPRPETDKPLPHV